MVAGDERARQGERERFAAVDLGSNSFHLLVAQAHAGTLFVLDRRKEMVRLAAGLDADRNLSKQKQKAAIEALTRLGELLKSIPDSNKRAVGTNTLRAARNSDDFLMQASQALNCPIDIIPGKEEARLVYRGVVHTVQPGDGNQLVVDIGGGSTECVIGCGFTPVIEHSLRMGCVSYTNGFFPDGAIEEGTLRAAVFAASNEVSSLQQEFLEAGFDVAIGSSGTIAAIRQCSIEEGWTEGDITTEALTKLRRYLLKVGHIAKIKLSGISERRREVLPGGVAILTAIFERLHLERMKYSEGALREGVLYDLIGRVSADDARDTTVRALQKRWGVSVAQAERVWRRLASFLDQAGPSLQLTDEKWRRMGRWAAELHEVGLAINYPGHHKHGAYLVENSDLPGFSKSEQMLLARLILCHRRRFRHEVFSELPGRAPELAVRLAMLLRLAVCVERMRLDDVSRGIELSVDAKRVVLNIARNAEDHALLQADLKAETEQLARAKFALTVSRES